MSLKYGFHTLQRVVMNKRHSRILIFCLICLFPTLQPAFSARSTGSEKKDSATPPVTVLIARPEDASFESTEDNKWFGALCDALFYFKFSGSGYIDAVPRDTVESNINQFFNLSRRLAEPDYKDLVKKFDVRYIIMQNYEVMRDNVQYLAEMISVEQSKVISTFEKTSPLSSLPRELDSCIIQFHRAAGLELKPAHARFLRTPLISSNKRNLRQFSKILLDDLYGSTRQSNELAEEYRKVVKRDVMMYLAHYYAARHCFRVEKYFEAASSLDNLLVTIGPFYPDLYIAASTSYRLAGNHDDAIRMAVLAEKAGMDQTGIILQKARALEARGDNTEAVTAYRNVLKKDSENPFALEFFARYFNQREKPAEALDYAEKLLAADPANGDGYLEKGKSLVVLNREENAQKAFERAVTFLENDPLPHK
ncbi:MAG: tetratricopeptide repeat protein, partial [Chitinivibrionales bacterium]|nr:tetratricopeptide repeat protein [Chitinivibrionales bacterium]